MRRLGQLVQVVVGLALLIGLVGGAVWVIYVGLTEAPGVVAAVVTGLAALFGLFFQRYLEWQREDARQRRERMTPIYEKLVKTFYESAGGTAGEQDWREFFEDLAQRLLLWGSPEILKAFGVWKTHASAAEAGSEHAAANLLIFEQLLFAMRKDIGQSNNDLSAGDLLRIIVKDFDDDLGAAA